MATAKETESVGDCRPVHSGFLEKKLPCAVCYRFNKTIKFCFKGNGLQNHFRAMHRERYTEAAENERVQLLKKLHGFETMEYVSKVCRSRYEKVSHELFLLPS